MKRREADGKKLQQDDSFSQMGVKLKPIEAAWDSPGTHFRGGIFTVITFIKFILTVQELCYRTNINSENLINPGSL